MILLAHCKATIDVDRQRVFAYITDMENYKEWFPGVVEIISTDALPQFSVGKRYCETIELPDGPGELIVEVIEIVVNERFVTEGSLDGILPRMTVLFVRSGENACTIDLRYESREPRLAANTTLLDSLRRDLTDRAQRGLKSLAVLLA